MRYSICLLALLITAVCAVPAMAQDSRNVTEPKLPPACTVLTARLAAPGGELSDEAERTPDTTRIQTAIDQCAPGQAVELRAAGAKNIFLSGPLALKPGVTLVVARGTALFASRNPRDYDLSPGSCGVVNEKGHGCKPILTAENAPGSGIMGDGVIDGRGGATLIGQKESWWDLARRAKTYDLSQSVTRMLVVRKSNDFTLYRITLRNSPNFHVSVEQTNGFTAWGVKIKTPKTGRNTDGIDPSSSTNVTITDCDIDTGDDNVAIKSGANGPAAHITVKNCRFYNGHGMSIGSGTNGGVNAIRVSGLTIDGADNGIRIKSDRSRGGLVHDIVYEDVCMRNVANPIVLNTMYTRFAGKLLPEYREITIKNVHSVTPGDVLVIGLDAEHKVAAELRDVSIAGLKPANLILEHAALTGEVKAAEAPACASRFAAFPALADQPAVKLRVLPEDPTFYVAASGTGDYYSVQRAIDVAPATGAVISIAPGTYREVLTINKPNIRLVSPYRDAKRTVIVNDKSAGTAGGTLNSATVNVLADNFSAENLTFANDFNATHPQTPVGSQALALLVTGDRAALRNVRLLGNQDTLYVGSKTCSGAKGDACSITRQYFEGCYIEGNVDFIFGDGKALFENCEIHNTPHQGGYVTAQGKHYEKQDSTFVFNHCRLTAAAGVEHVWLGRPWRPYASVVFLNTEMGAHIESAGWREWHPGETKYMDTVFYAEYNSSGPGAHKSERDPHTRHLTAEEAAQYETRKFFAAPDDWNPLP